MAKTTAPITAQESRPRRTAVARRNKLSIQNKEEGYQYRIVNAVDGRVDEFIERGYEIDPNTQVGDKRVDSPTPLGSAKSIPVGNGIQAVVMRQRKDYYAEDQAIKQSEIDELEASMNNAAKRGV